MLPLDEKTAEALPLVVYTVGHSTRSFNEFVEILRAYGIERVADVRTSPDPGITLSSTGIRWVSFSAIAESGTGT